MATKILSARDFDLNQLLNAVAHILATDPTIREGRFFYHSGTKTFRFQTDTQTVVLGSLDQVTPPAADVSLNGHKATNAADPVNPQDVATRAFVEQVAVGISDRIADPVRVASGANIDVTAPGTTIDGVTMAVGDRVLLRAQTTTTDNDLWRFEGDLAAMTRITEDPVIDGTLVAVAEGTSAGSVYVQRTTPSGARGTWSQDWAFFGGGSTYSADESTLHLEGSVFSLISPVALTNGGTGATTASAARTNLGATGKFAATIGDGLATSIAVTHNLGTQDVLVSVHDAASFAEIECDVVKTDANTTTLSFTNAPATSSLRVTVVG